MVCARRRVLAGVGAAGAVPAHGGAGAERGVGGAVADGAPPRRGARLAPLHLRAARALQRVRAALPPRPSR